VPGVRVELNPTQMSNLGIGLEDVRTVLAAANANRPKGELANNTQTWGLSTTDQLLKAEDYQPLIVRYQNGSRDSAFRYRVGQGLRRKRPRRRDGRWQAGGADHVFRQPGANIIDTVDRIYRRCRNCAPRSRPRSASPWSWTAPPTIRASVRDVDSPLMISIALVIMVVFLFLRNLRATLIPGIVVSALADRNFGIMYLLGYSLDNLSLMALTICTGFVVDDADRRHRNISRFREQGMAPLEAAIRRRRHRLHRRIDRISLVAVFIPILLMSGIVGRCSASSRLPCRPSWFRWSSRSPRPR